MPTRRTFLSAVPFLLTAAKPLEPTVLPLLDTHQHLVDFSRVRLSWLKPGDELAAACTPADYAQAAAGTGITKAVFMEVDAVPDDKPKEATWIQELCRAKQTVTVAAVVGGRPGSPGFRDFVKPFRDVKIIKGVRQVLQGSDWPTGSCLKPEFVRDVQYLGELGLCWDLCGPPTELTNFAKLITLCPDTRFILDHGGNPRVDFTPEDRAAWLAGLQAVAARPNTVCKLSGFLANAPVPPNLTAAVQPYADAILDTFGANRVMFGSDWFVVNKAVPLARWVETVRAVLARRPEREQAAVLAGTAEAFYGI